ncbi:protease B nonderepressible form [Coemansia biformis]|uniref:Protein PBN1 n=1 Tax=Coemansia biformis TaxID=1286918 RepID=A0A9W8CXS8_9FUNG|nr:protease B nonderepressible form [Coemansia biformis]
MTTSGSAGDGWSFGSAGGSWHVWSYGAALDRAGLPPWPADMEEARVVLSTEMCRPAAAQSIPPAPFMPPRDLEHCGTHTIATARDSVPRGAPMAAARAQMRQWLSAFAGWGPVAPEPVALGPAAFVELGAASIYHFRAHSAATLGLRRGQPLDLATLAAGACRGLGALPAPAVTHHGARWLDNYRLEVRLRRTAHGRVQASVQIISLLPPAPDIVIEPLANTTSRIAWLGPTKDADAFMLTAGQARPSALRVPGELYARDPALFAGEVSARTANFASFHPELVVAASVQLPPGLERDVCRLATVAVLPRTYFFDPYQLRQLHDEDRLGAAYSHYGPTELELPAESLGNWGSALVLTRAVPEQQLTMTIPIHARYRLLPIDEPTVGYHGEPAGGTHVDQTLPPPLAAVVCAAPDASPTAPGNDSILDKLHVRLALFDELGLVPAASLMVAADTDTLLRMPVPSAQHASLIQASTVVLLFAGALITLHSVYLKARSMQI